jgi:hypothetical protein
MGLNRAGCPDPEERSNAELGKFLDGDRCGRTADSGRANDEWYSVCPGAR